MSWKKFKDTFEEIFRTDRYTNHGPRVEKLEELLAQKHGRKNALMMTNKTIAVLIYAKALGIKCNVFDAGSRELEKKVLADGQVEIVEFGEEGINGAALLVDDGELAERLRNIRSSYGAREKVQVPITGNGRMSEAQAAMILMEEKNYKESIL